MRLYSRQRQRAGATRARAVRRLVAVLLPAMLAPVHAAWADDCYSRTGCVETARSATSFTESVGINTHLGYADTIYGQRYEDLIRPRLRELGVSHIRDGTWAAHGHAGPTIAGRYRELGLGLNLLVGLEQGPSWAVQARLNWIKSNNLAPQVVGIEGSNESWDDATAIRNLQCDVYWRVKNDPALASKPVIGPSAGPPFYMSAWYGRIGDLSGCLDRGNLHPYPGEDPPHLQQGRDLSAAMDWGRRTYGSKPYWVTESGYWNRSPNGSHVSEWAGGVYIPRLYMEYFRRGIARTQAYELIDINSATSVALDNYGLLRTDGSRKPAFTALANTMAVLADSAAASGSLGFGIVCTSNCHSPIRHVLLKHSSGAYYLAVWSESRVWDGERDTPRGAQAIDLVLHERPGAVQIIDPASSTTPFKTVTGAATVSTNATDHVRLIKITPAPPPSAPAAGPVWVVGWEAETAAVSPSYSGWVVHDLNSSSSKRLFMHTYGTASKSIATSRAATTVVVTAKGDQCSEASGQSAPRMTLTINGTTIGSRDVASATWRDYAFQVALPAGTYDLQVTYPNDYEDARCNRGLDLDYVSMWGG